MAVGHGTPERNDDGHATSRIPRRQRARARRRRYRIVRRGWHEAAGRSGGGPSGSARLHELGRGEGRVRARSELAHLSGFFLASHPRVVRDAIDEHRRGLDTNPIAYVERNVARLESAVRNAAAEYAGVGTDELASSRMGNPIWLAASRNAEAVG